MHFQEISVWSVPTLEHRRREGLPTKELSPECLQMTARNPPGGRIDYLTRHRKEPGSVSRHFPGRSGQQLEVQIFGVKKSADTRKALRFFSERRVKTHFVDLMERPASLGELRRFAQKFGVSALIDRDSKRFNGLGLRYSQLSDDQWLEKLSEEPLLLRLPLVRNANRLVIGVDEATWKSWMQP